MALNPGTQNQVPEHSILDYFNKQTYLGNSFTIISKIASTASTSETPVYLIKNPSIPNQAFPAGHKSLFHGYLNLGYSDVANFNLYANPTVVSNGTPIIPVNIRSGSSNTSVSLCYSSPTVSSNGTLIFTNPGTEFATFSNFLYIIDPGATLLLTVAPSATGLTITSQSSWFEI